MNNVIGSGLIGSKFAEKNVDTAFYFCSGVSNSNEQDNNQFLREIDKFNKVKKIFSPEFQVFIYFSSVLAPTLNNKYYKHKMEMEGRVKQNFPNNYLIFRLPQVVGNVVNTTLFPELVRRISQDIPISVHKNATRALIDVDDVVRITNIFAEKKERRKVIELIPSESLNVMDIINAIADELNMPAKFVYKNAGNVQLGDTHLLENTLSSSDPLLNDGYVIGVIRKYARNVRALVQSRIKDL